MSKSKLPSFLKKYFWDVEFKGVHLQQHRDFVLMRVLELGDEEAVQWMWENFNKEEMKNVLSKYRGFSSKSANFWAVILNTPREEVLCLRKPSPKGPEKIWPY